MTLKPPAKEPLRIWSVTKHPSDCPDGYVARLFLNDKPTQTFVMSTSYEVIEGHMLDLHLHRLERMPDDESHIMEVWL